MCAIERYRLLLVTGLVWDLTGLGPLGNGAVPHLVLKLGPVVVHVDDVNDDVDGVLHLVPVQVHSVGPQLNTSKRTQSQHINEEQGIYIYTIYIYIHCVYIYIYI